MIARIKVDWDARSGPEKKRNGGPTMRADDEVRLNLPGNDRLHGTIARIVELTEWGAHCHAPAAGTSHKQFRAHWSEMEPVVTYTGDVCQNCGGSCIVCTGSCKTCQDCGDNEGCG